MLKHLSSFLIGADFFQALSLQVTLLELLQPAAVIPSSSDQDIMSFICIQKHYKTEYEFTRDSGFGRDSASISGTD